MRVGVQRHADIAVSHDILQRLGIHSGLCHVGTESVPTHMGCDLRQLHTIGLVVLGNHMLHVLLPVKRHHRHIVLVQAEETRMAVDHRFLPRFLPVLDNLERAEACKDAEGLSKGLELTLKSFRETLERLGIQEIDALGETFDPNVHNAVFHVDDEAYGESEIVEVLMKGYKKGDKVVRYAMVKVAN